MLELVYTPYLPRVNIDIACKTMTSSRQQLQFRTDYWNGILVSIEIFCIFPTISHDTTMHCYKYFSCRLAMPVDPLYYYN